MYEQRQTSLSIASWITIANMKYIDRIELYSQNYVS